MNGELVWNRIISELSQSGEELQTKRGLWFKVYSKNERLYVNRAIENVPSSKISMERPISKKEFLFVYSYYERWVNQEEGVRKELSKKSMNSTYIFALIEKFNA